MNLIVDTFVDGTHQSTREAMSIRFGTESLLRADPRVLVQHVLRTRYFHDSRFHVYLYQYQTGTATTLVFRYAA